MNEKLKPYLASGITIKATSITLTEVKTSTIKILHFFQKQLNQIYFYGTLRQTQKHTQTQTRTIYTYKPYIKYNSVETILGKHDLLFNFVFFFLQFSDTNAIVLYELRAACYKTLTHNFHATFKISNKDYSKF